MKYLIINADDFGLCSGVNLAILESHRQGIVTSASLIVNMPGFKQGVEIAHEYPALDIGLHIMLAKGYPVCLPEQVTSIVTQKGFFYSRSQLLMRLLQGKVKKQDLRREIYAQVKKVSDTGLKPSHIDADQHTHVFPMIREIVVDIAKEFGIALRVPDEKFFWRKSDLRPFGLNVSSFMAKLSLRYYSRMLMKLCKQNAIPANKHFLSYFGIFPRKNPCIEDLILLMKNVEENSITDLMVHPGYSDSELIKFWNNADYANDREDELKILVSDHFKEALRLHNIKLITYSSLLK